MKNIDEIEARCIEDLSTDYVPLNDIIREFSGYEKLIPSEKEFLNALLFLEYIIYKYDLEYSTGPGNDLNIKTVDELINIIKNKWYTNKYEDINYGIWFQKI